MIFKLYTNILKDMCFTHNWLYIALKKPAKFDIYSIPDSSTQTSAFPWRPKSTEDMCYYVYVCNFFLGVVNNFVLRTILIYPLSLQKIEG